MACNPNQIIAALHEEKDNVNDITRERINTSDRMILRLIPDGGLVERSSNQESIIYGEANQAPMQYRNLDHDPRDLVPGEMEGATLAGRNGLFQTSVNDIDENACHGFCTIEYGQGFRRRGYQDYGIDVDTPIKCARELDRLGPAHIRGYFEGFRRQFSKFGFDNFDDNLTNLAIKNGEANSSVIAGTQFNVSKGGWQAPPQLRMSIHFLEDYRDFIMAEMEMLAMKVSEDWTLDVELTRDDWFDAVTAHQAHRKTLEGPSGDTISRVSLDLLTDPEGPMRGRRFHQYGNIRCYFNERPIRGFYKRVGTVDGNANYEFVRIFYWKNEPGEEGGLVLKPNHMYREDRVYVDGVWYDTVTLMPHIHPKSFTRYRLKKPITPDGVGNMGVNYEVKLVEGDILGPTNVHGDKFGFAARHEFRFKTKYPELSGYVAFRHGRREPYEIPVVPRDYTGGPDEFAGHEEFRECDLIDPVTTENCAECGEVPTVEGDCVLEADAALGVVGLEPCGYVATVFDGEPSKVRLALRRTGELARAGSVTVNTADDTALAGTHYTAIAGLVVDFIAGQEFAYVDVEIIGGSGDPADNFHFDVALSVPVDVTLGTCVVTTIAISDLS